ncbi:hypothetical protein JXB11_03020 [Candidatus Woesearchaeota archaeon]|nr:hypothetical protein [Candidatus Woesearchaeota archaeon]
METEEEADSWYEARKQELLTSLLGSIEKKEDVDKAEALYTKELKKVFEQYKKRRIAAAENSIKSSKKPAQKKKLFSGIRLPVKFRVK